MIFEGIKGKRVLITGASGGIGAEIARVFADYGAILGLHYLSNEKSVSELLKEITDRGVRAEIFQADLFISKSQNGLFREFTEKFGGIDVLINAAGAVYDYKHFSELPEDSFKKTFGLNVRAPFYMTSKAFVEMKKEGGGKIVNLSSANVKYGGSAKSLHYVASKAALESLTLGFAREGAKDNILVNAVRCGLIDTPMRKKIAGYTEEDFRKRMEMVPLKRAGTPRDIAQMVLFLAAETGDFITGEIFTVAGGD